MIPRTGSSHGSSTPLADVPRQEPPATQAQAAPPGLDNLSNRRASSPGGGRHAPRTALSKGKGKAPASSAPAASASGAPPVAPVALLREHAATLMALDTQRRELLLAAQAAGPHGPAVAGPPATKIAQLSDAVERLEIKAEELSRQAQKAQADFDNRASRLAQGLERLAASVAEQAAAAQERPAGSQPPRPARQDRPDAAAVSPGALPDAPEALALWQAKHQLEEAQRQLAGAHDRFGSAIKDEKQRRDNAEAEAKKFSDWAEWTTTFAGLVHGMGNKIGVDSRTALEELGLPPVQEREGADGHKDSLQQEFQTYRAGLTERTDNGRWQFRDVVQPGLSRLMAFDALVRTSMPAPVNSVAISACNAYAVCNPGSNVPGPEAAGVMARLGLDSVAIGCSALSIKELAQAGGRQKVDKAVRQMGVRASEARKLKELRKKDLRGVSEPARRLHELMKEHRIELEQTLSDFMLTGLLGVQKERARFLAEAEAARQRASQQDPALARLIEEVHGLMEAVKLAKAKVQELEPPRRDPPPPGTAAAHSASSAATVPQIQAALPGPGLARDPETRIAKERGWMLERKAERDSAQKNLDEVTKTQALTNRALQETSGQLDAAIAAHARAHEAARQEWAQQRALQGKHAARLKELDGQIKAARAGLCEDPALQRLIDPGALQRVIKVHVDPDDEAVRQRALEETGLNARYDSLGHLAEVLAEVHEAAKSKYPQLFAARTPGQFERAAQADAAYDASRKALVNLPHDHRRLVGYGYDARKIDRTDRLIPLTKSEYSLAWCEDGVKVSHLHPSVPRRTP